MRIKTKFKINDLVYKVHSNEYPGIKCGYITGIKFHNDKLTYFVKWGDLHRYPDLLETEEIEEDILTFKELKSYIEYKKYTASLA